MKSPEHIAMELPPGKTCDNCWHSWRCFTLGYSQSGRTSCDFYPNRFNDRPAVGSVPPEHICKPDLASLASGNLP